MKGIDNGVFVISNPSVQLCDKAQCFFLNLWHVLDQQFCQFSFHTHQLLANEVRGAPNQISSHSDLAGICLGQGFIDPTYILLQYLG